MALDITKGLSYLHSQRIIHRDIKLHNVILNDKHKCKLIDFGIARKAKYWKSSIE
jgi:serine/threonine protein kinase